jgi:transcriptional regulator with XRE-family HTH domain
MTSDIYEATALKDLGARLRAERLRRNDTMEVMGQRMQVSIPTLRDMERGAPTVAIGTWVRALAVLNRLSDIEAVLAPVGSIIDRARLQGQQRQRARRRIPT